jgi:hypothetical protein
MINAEKPICNLIVSMLKKKKKPLSALRPGGARESEFHLPG